MSSSEPKQYGLILPSKNKGKTGVLGTRKLNPLLDSDDELCQDEESPLNWVEESLKKSAGNSGQQSLQKRLLREALEEDESVFQYDEVYDTIQEAKTSQQAVKDPSSKKPKYIQNLLKHAEKRKLESERRNERKVQKEREAEGDEFADKESFVTASYLKKMEELKKAEEDAKLQEIKEEQVDVMKHKNFGVFYSHLFKQRMGETSIKKEPKSEDEETESTADKNSKKKDEGKRQKHYRTQRDLSESPEVHRWEEKCTISRHSSPSSSDSETAKKTESYRDRREQYNTERNRDIEKENRKFKHQTPEKIRERRGKSRERHHRRERTPDQERRHKGRHRSRSRDKKQRHSRSRSPTSHRATESDRRERRSYKSSPSTSKVESSRSIKKEKLSPDRNNSKELKDNKNDKRSNGDKVNGEKAANVDGVKIKKESEQEEKEKRQERIRKLFTKRTVGDKFVEALERYYQRKAEREAQG